MSTFTYVLVYGHVLNGLARGSYGLNRVGHPGIHVTAYDPDYVANTNIGRQIFTEYDIGSNKAQIAIDRLNTSLRTNWKAYPSSERNKWMPLSRTYVGAAQLVYIPVTRCVPFGRTTCAPA